ncbi:MAG: PAS domain-containing protein [Rhodospirillales bacterium]
MALGAGNLAKHARPQPFASRGQVRRRVHTSDGEAGGKAAMPTCGAVRSCWPDTATGRRLRAEPPGPYAAAMDQEKFCWQDDQVLAAIYVYWDTKRAGRAMPSRRDIDPVEFAPQVLPHVLLTQTMVEDGRRRYRFRLAGTALRESLGLDITGHYIDTVNPNKRYAVYVESLYAKAMEAKRPVFSSSVAMTMDAASRRLTRRLICPLSNDGVAVDMFRCGQTFQAFGAGPLPTMTYADRFDQGVVKVIPPR